MASGGGTGFGDFGSIFTCTVPGAGIGSGAPGTGRTGGGGTLLARGRIGGWRRFAGVLGTRDDPAADALLLVWTLLHAGVGAGGGPGAVTKFNCRGPLAVSCRAAVAGTATGAGPRPYLGFCFGNGWAGPWKRIGLIRTEAGLRTAGSGICLMPGGALPSLSI